MRPNTKIVLCSVILSLSLMPIILGTTRRIERVKARSDVMEPTEQEQAEAVGAYAGMVAQQIADDEHHVFMTEADRIGAAIRTLDEIDPTHHWIQAMKTLKEKYHIKDKNMPPFHTDQEGKLVPIP